MSQKKKKNLYQLEDNIENGQKDLGTKSKTTKFAQLQEEENMVVVLMDVKIMLEKKKKCPQLINEVTDIALKNQTAVRIQAEYQKKKSDDKDSECCPRMF